MSKIFTIFFFFVSWQDISLGVSLDVKQPHIDVHIPFGFVRIGWETRSGKSINHAEVEKKTHYLTGAYK